MLALFGELDQRVLPLVNVPVCEALARDDGSFEFEVLPRANHMLQPCEAGGIDRWSAIETTIAPEALARMRVWLSERLGVDHEPGPRSPQ